MSLWSRWFGRGSGEAPQPAAEPEIHKGYRIIPDPIPVGGQFRIAARIEKELGDQIRSHHLIRADLLPSREEAEAAARAKSRQMIDEQGDGIFG